MNEFDLTVIWWFLWVYGVVLASVTLWAVLLPFIFWKLMPWRTPKKPWMGPETLSFPGWKPVLIGDEITWRTPDGKEFRLNKKYASDLCFNVDGTLKTGGD